LVVSTRNPIDSRCELAIAATMSRRPTPIPRAAGSTKRSITKAGSDTSGHGGASTVMTAPITWPPRSATTEPARRQTPYSPAHAASTSAHACSTVPTVPSGELAW